MKNYIELSFSRPEEFGFKKPTSAEEFNAFNVDPQRAKSIVKNLPDGTSTEQVKAFYEKTNISVGYEFWNEMISYVVDRFGSYSEPNKPTVLPLTGEYAKGKEDGCENYDIFISKNVKNVEIKDGELVVTEFLDE